MLKKICFLVLFFLSIHSGYSQRIDFFREDINFSLKAGELYVDGLYYFHNARKQEVNLRLNYPFPHDAAFGEVDSVFCYPVGNPEISRVIKSEKEQMYFELIVAPGDTTVYRIGYRHKLFGNKARYILTTTSSWGKAFDTANYVLLVEDLVVDSLSYIPDKVEVSENNVKFLWYKRNFMPKQDMIIYFHEPAIRQASD